MQVFWTPAITTVFSDAGGRRPKSAKARSRGKFGAGFEGRKRKRVMDVAKYVAQENVRRFRRELEDGAAGARQDMMLRLLVEEENKVGLTNEQLDEVLRQIGRIKQIISTQLDTIGMLKAAGYSLERAERSLSNACRLLVAHEVYRAKSSETPCP